MFSGKTQRNCWLSDFCAFCKCDIACKFKLSYTVLVEEFWLFLRGLLHSSVFVGIKLHTSFRNHQYKIWTGLRQYCT